MKFEHITFEVQNGAARLTLNKPPLNVLDIAMMSEITSVIEGLLDDSAIKVLIFDVAEDSKVFSAGVDISEHTAEQVDEMIGLFHKIFRLLDELEIPTMAVVGGAALGGGCELVLFCDLVVASEKASFGQPEIQVGVFPPVAAVALPGIIGPKRAMEMVLIGDRMKAEDALQIGLINMVVPTDDLDEAADEIVSKLTKLSGSILRLTKRAMRIGIRHSGTFSQALDSVEELYLGPMMATEDAHEGLTAYMEKRPPVWKNK